MHEMKERMLPRPALDWFLAACAGMVVVVAGLVAQAKLIGGSVDAIGGSPGAFYLEAAGVVFNPQDHPGGPAISRVRWWSQDATHGRVEYETVGPALEAGTTTIVGDGRRLWFHDSRDNTYSVMAYPEGGERPAFFPLFSGLLLGPLPFASIDDLVAALSERNASSAGESSSATPRGGGQGQPAATPTPTPAPRGPATITQGEPILGRRTLLISTPGGTKVWIDPETDFVLRTERKGGPEGTDYSFEVTALRLGAVDSAVFRFAPPAGATEAPDSSSVSSSGSLGPGRSSVSVPSGFLRPGLVPAGYSVAGEGQSVDGRGTFALEIAFTAGRAEDAPFLRIGQRKRLDFPAGLREGRRVTVRGRDGWVDEAAGVTTLAWYEDGAAILLTASALSGEELIEFAEGMSRAP